MSHSLSFLFAGGGTGGHLLPGIAMGNAVMDVYPGSRIVYLVPGKPIDKAIISGTRFRWHLNPMRPFPRAAGQLGSFGAAFIRGFGATWRVFRQYRPNVVIGLGGYGALSAGIVAHSRDIPLFLLESNRVAGKVVRWLAPWSRAIYTNGEIAGVPPGKIKQLGIPVREELLCERNIAVGNGPVRLLIMGGSQGARCINRAMCEAIPFLMDLRERLHLLHLCGNSDGEAFEQIYLQNGFTAKVCPFSPNMGEFYREADLVICRAGGSTLAEITAVGLPAILIPFAGAADGHQQANALAMKRRDAAVVVEEKELNGRLLADLVRDLIRQPQRLVEMAGQAKLQGKPKASLAIIEDILATIN